MSWARGPGPGLGVFLTVGCGIALQLFLIRHALMLIGSGAAFSTLAAHIGGWGLGLGLAVNLPVWLRQPALLASAAVGAACLGGALSTTSTAMAGGWGTTGFLATACASGALTGLSIAWALSACANPLVALAGDLSGVATGALGHVLMAASFPRLPSPALWIGALAALAALRSRVGVAFVAALAGAVLLFPLEQPERLARADNPLGEALRRRGVDAWKASFYDQDGRVDAVENPGYGGVELFINGGTQAQTPGAGEDRVTASLARGLGAESALVLGAGGLADVATLLERDVRRVVAVERSRAVLRGARELSAPARSLFDDERVDVIPAEARHYLESGSERFDLVYLPLAYAAAGVAPAGLIFYPSYLFTVEGIAAQARATTPDGAICFALPATQLRDRLLATIGTLERRRGRRHSLARRLWVERDPAQRSYAELVCWAPHESLPAASPSPALTVLHGASSAASGELRKRLDGAGTLPPAWDSRPYFFDLYSLHPAGVQLPPALPGLPLWSPLALGLGVVALRLRGRGKAGDPAASHLAVAFATGMAFPALEYLALSVGRASGLSEGLAFASVAVAFAVAGLAAMAPAGSVRARALLGMAAMLGLVGFLAVGGIGWLFRIEAPARLFAGLLLMIVTMSAGAAPFAGLFRAERRRTGSPDVRQLFLASALGTLTAVAPVLLIELRWGGYGCAIAAAVAYGLAAALSMPRIALPTR